MSSRGDFGSSSYGSSTVSYQRYNANDDTGTFLDTAKVSYISFMILLSGKIIAESMNCLINLPSSC